VVTGPDHATTPLHHGALWPRGATRASGEGPPQTANPQERAPWQQGSAWPSRPCLGHSAPEGDTPALAGRQGAPGQVVEARPWARRGPPETGCAPATTAPTAGKEAPHQTDETRAAGGDAEASEVDDAGKGSCSGHASWSRRQRHRTWRAAVGWQRDGHNAQILGGAKVGGWETLLQGVGSLMDLEPAPMGLARWVPGSSP
jgi:hypothetical protein